MKVKTAPPDAKEDGEISRDKAKKQDQKVQLSFAETEHHIIEQINDGAPSFLFYNKETGEVTRKIAYTDGFNRLVQPILDEEVTKGYIGLPSNVEEYNTEEDLDREIDQFIKEWLDIPELERKFAIYNIRKSWVYERFHTLNYSRALGEPGAGKSRYLDVIGGLHYKPIKTSGALTTAPLFRVIAKWKGTVILDEADLKHGDETNDIIKIINQGFEKGAYIMRCNPNDPTKLDFFDVYCPKVISTRRPFEDKATESRCLTTVMTGTNRRDIPPNLNERFFTKLQSLRNKLLLWRFRSYNKIDPNAGEKVDFGNIEPRLRQVSTGFIALFAHNEHEIKRWIDFLTGYQKQLVEERANTIEGQIIRAICQLVTSNAPVTATHIIELANLRTKHGQHWTPRALTSYMKTLGFEASKAERHNGEVLKVYPVPYELIIGLAERYVTDEDLLVKVRNHVTVVTVVTVIPENIENSRLDGFLEEGEMSVTSVTTVTKLQKLDEYLRTKDKGYGVAPESISLKFPEINLKDLEFKGRIYFTPDGWVKPL